MHLSVQLSFSDCNRVSVGVRTNEALCQLSYEAPYLDPEECKPGRPTQAVNSIIMSKIWQEDGPPGQRALCLSTYKHNGKSGTEQSEFFGYPYNPGIETMNSFENKPKNFTKVSTSK